MWNRCRRTLPSCPNAAWQSTIAFSRIASNTGARITSRGTDNLQYIGSRCLPLQACLLVEQPAFSIAITACAAKLRIERDLLSENGRTSLRLEW